MKATKDPKVKLTLTVSKSAVENAKKYAIEHGTSLSSLVDSYLSGIRPKPEKTTPPYSINQMFGFLKDSPMRDMTDREIKDMMIKDKYGI